MLFAESLETVKCFDDGVLTSVEDANIGSIFGIGFPAWTGGTRQYAKNYSADGREVTGVLDRRTGRDANGCAHLGGNDHGQGGLAQPGRTGEQDMVRGATATASGSEYQAKLIGDPLLALELGQGAGSQGDLLSLLRGICPRRHR